VATARFMLALLLLIATSCSHKLEINEHLLPYGWENKNCADESCIIRSLPPVGKSELQQFVQENPWLWNAESNHSLDKTKLRYTPC